MATVLSLQREGAVAEDAHVTLELRWRGDLVGGRFGVVGHLAQPGGVAIEAGVVTALRGAVADVTSSFVAAVDALVVLGVGSFAPLAWKRLRWW